MILIFQPIQIYRGVAVIFEQPVAYISTTLQLPVKKVLDPFNGLSLNRNH